MIMSGNSELNNCMSSGNLLPGLFSCNLVEQGPADRHGVLQTLVEPHQGWLHLVTDLNIRI